MYGDLGLLTFVMGVLLVALVVGRRKQAGRPAAATTPSWLEVELQRLRRQRDEYLACVYAFEAQRDKWKRMFLGQTVAHNNAHFALERALIAERERLVRAVRTINSERADHGKEPIRRAEELGQIDPHGHPVGAAKEFCEAMFASFTAAERDLDAAAEIRSLKNSAPSKESLLDEVSGAADIARQLGHPVADALALAVEALAGGVTAEPK